MKKRGRKTIDLTGKRFGKLIVIKRVETPPEIKNNKPYWLCKCDCGNERIIRGSSLTSERTRSCGCIRIINCHKIAYNNKNIAIRDLTGESFGRLVVIKRVIYTEGIRKGKLYWLCKCDCGKVVSVSGNSLKSGSTKSCGCYRSENFKKIFTKRPALIINFKTGEVL